MCVTFEPRVFTAKSGVACSKPSDLLGRDTCLVESQFLAAALLPKTEVTAVDAEYSQGTKTEETYFE